MRWRFALLQALILMCFGTMVDRAEAAAGTTAAAQGRVLFEQKCAACHSIGAGHRVGPDLQGVSERRSGQWLLRMITAPESLIAEGDPVVTALVRQFNQIVMPNLGLSETEARAVLEHIAAASVTPGVAHGALAPMPRPDLATAQSAVLRLFAALAAVVVLVFVWIGRSTRRPADVDTHRAYGMRRVLFIVALAMAIGALAATLPRAPYATADTDADRVVYVAARQFDFVFSDAPITSVEDLGHVARISNLELPAGAVIEFRVTSLDVNHGFGLYGPERQIVAQTQAMPGYFNRLRVRLGAPGEYRVLCLEFCAAGHHLMQGLVTVL